VYSVTDLGLRGCAKYDQPLVLGLSEKCQQI
jgi:hypothetical protein